MNLRINLLCIEHKVNSIDKRSQIFYNKLFVISVNFSGWKEMMCELKKNLVFSFKFLWHVCIFVINCQKVVKTTACDVNSCSIVCRNFTIMIRISWIVCCIVMQFFLVFLLIFFKIVLMYMYILFSLIEILIIQKWAKPWNIYDFADFLKYFWTNDMLWVEFLLF